MSITDRPLSEHPLHHILHPKRVVVAGASPNPSKMGSLQAMNVVGNGFQGDVVFLHPTATEILGKPAVATPGELPFVPDVALLVTPTSVTVDLLDELGEMGLRYAIVTTAGFAEVGAEGRGEGQRLVAVAEKHGIRFVGPNCIGVLNAQHPFNSTVLPTMTAPGPLSLVSQSGTFVAQLPVQLQEKGIRYGKAISIGNGASISMVDGLEYLGADPETRAIALYIEGLGELGRRFLEVAREVTRFKPVVALYVGSTGAGGRAGMSHTASLGGPDRIYDGVFEQAGVLRATTVSELFDWSWALATQPLPKGNRVAVLTHSGGPATCMADECERQGMHVPELSEPLQRELKKHLAHTASSRNPIDMTFMLDYSVFTEVLPQILLGSDEIDALLVHGMMDTGFVDVLFDVIAPHVPVTREQLIDTLRMDVEPFLEAVHASGKPLAASTFVHRDAAARTMRAAGVPLTDDPQTAVRALASLCFAARIARRAPWREAKLPADAGTLASPESLARAFQVVTGEGAAEAGPRALDEAASKRLLVARGLPVPEERRVESLDEALVAAGSLGWPVVLKGLPAGVAHTSEVGLVHLRLGDEPALREAWRAIEVAAPGCARLVAPMLDGERELLAGLTREPGFGVVVTLGLGGRFAEALDDTCSRVAPLSRPEALAMIDGLHAKAVFGATRGLAALDREALADILITLGRVGLDLPWVREVDLNPILVDSQGTPRVADALVVVGA